MIATKPEVDLALSIRASLRVISSAWKVLIDPPQPIGVTNRWVPGPTLPVDTTILSFRVELARDLAYWAHRLHIDHPEGRAEPLDLTDSLAVMDHLRREAEWAAHWTYGKRMAYELEDHAREARYLAWPPSRNGILLGECPVTIAPQGEPVECQGRVRAKVDAQGDIACPRCKTKDTIDGWILRLTGTDGLVTLPQLVPILRRRLGVSVDVRTLQRWHAQGRLLSAGGTEGKPLFDRRHALAVVVARDERRALRGRA